MVHQKAIETLCLSRVEMHCVGWHTNYGLVTRFGSGEIDGVDLDVASWCNYPFDSPPVVESPARLTLVIYLRVAFREMYDLYCNSKC